jgi:hypothetical protein
VGHFQTGEMGQFSAGVDTSRACWRRVSSVQAIVISVRFATKQNHNLLNSLN